MPRRLQIIIGGFGRSGGGGGGSQTPNLPQNPPPSLRLTGPYIIYQGSIVRGHFGGVPLL